MTLQEMLQQEVNAWATLGHPALLTRFILRNGKSYTPRKRIGRKRRAKECYANAAHFVVGNENGAQYVEGYALNTRLPLMPFHHAWVTTTGSDAMDPTLNAPEYDYFGVTFDDATLRKELIRNGVYGLLDPGLGLNHRLMFEIDPELEAICNAVKRKEYVDV